MWLVADRVAREMRAKIQMGLTVGTDAQAAFGQLAVDAANNGKPRNYNVAGDVAEIKVEGLLTERPDFFAWLMGYGNTTYADIQQSIAMAEMDPGVKRIQYRVNSPGGQVNGLFETLGAIQDSKKPRSVLANYAASAAYAVAAVAGPITAAHAAVEVGSIGVAASFMVMDEIVDVANTESPKKRPDLATEEGKSTVREELDALFDIFVEAIAWGRSTTVKDVVENFGRGGVFVAGEAKKRGMIDKIQRPMLRAVSRQKLTSVVVDEGGVPQLADQLPPPAVLNQVAPAADDAAGEPVAAVVAAPEPTAEPAASGGAKKERAMDQKTLEKEHPELFAAVLQQGVTTERDRVVAHLEMGEGSGDMKTAVESIKSGALMTQTLVATYAKASMNRNSVEARQKAGDAAVAATAGAIEPTTKKDFGDLVADRLEAMHGISK